MIKATGLTALVFSLTLRCGGIATNGEYQTTIKGLTAVPTECLGTAKISTKIPVKELACSNAGNYARQDYVKMCLGGREMTPDEIKTTTKVSCDYETGIATAYSAD